VSLEDEYQLSDRWTVTAGLRADRRLGYPTTWSPRFATVWTPDQEWTFKASHGRSALYRSASEVTSPSSGDDDNPPRDEAVSATTSELVSEFRRGRLRLLGSGYRFTTRNQQGDGGTLLSAGGRGAELEAEWQSDGWRLRGSQAWQDADPGAGQVLFYSPRHLTKLQVSAPVVGESLRASLAVRHVGAYRSYDLAHVPSRTLLDLTLASQRAVQGLDVRLGWRNVLQKRDVDVETYWPQPEQGYATRSAWIELTGTFR
jgi:iron complex outermembrane receptor protein